jgi:hypothetical protein
MAPPDPIHGAVITPHARFEIERRGISEDTVRSVLMRPEQSEEARRGRMILQSRVSMGSQTRVYLVRVFVDIDREPPEVVTAYRTSKLAKYWRIER